MQLVFGVVIGIGLTLLVGTVGWQFHIIGELRGRIAKMEKAMRKRLPYDAQKFAENTAAGLVLAEQELTTQLDAVRNAKAWNAKLLSLGLKCEREELDDRD